MTTHVLVNSLFLDESSYGVHPKKKRVFFKCGFSRQICLIWYIYIMFIYYILLCFFLYIHIYFGEIIQFWRACVVKWVEKTPPLDASRCSIYFVAQPSCDPDPKFIVQWVDAKKTIKPKHPLCAGGEHSALVLEIGIFMNIRKWMVSSGSQGAHILRHIHSQKTRSAYGTPLINELTFGLKPCFSQGINES